MASRQAAETGLRPAPNDCFQPSWPNTTVVCSVAYIEIFESAMRPFTLMVKPLVIVCHRMCIRVFLGRGKAVAHWR